LERLVDKTGNSLAKVESQRVVLKNQPLDFSLELYVNLAGLDLVKLCQFL
jgi:hypothetical protein